MNRSGRAVPLFAAGLFLFLAFQSGSMVRNRYRVDISGNLNAVGSGIERLRRVAASALYLQMDDYHHIGMYQGQSWTTITDYLPQAWLVSRLDPSFSTVFVDAANHLAVNLGMAGEGLELARQGVLHNPDSLDIRYEYAFLLYETGVGEPAGIMAAVLDYNVLLRMNGGDHGGPFREASASMLASEALSGPMPRFAELYRRRSEFTGLATRAGLFYPGYLHDSPEELDGGHQ